MINYWRLYETYLSKKFRFVIALLCLCTIMYISKPITSMAWGAMALIPGLQGFAFSAVGVFWSTVAGICNPLAGAAVGL